MEGTGSYWQTLFHTLQKAGFEVMLVQGNQTKTCKERRRTSLIVCGNKIGDDQDIVVAGVLISYAAFRIPVLHPHPRRMAPEQDHFLGIHRLHDDPGDLSQLLLLVLR